MFARHIETLIDGLGLFEQDLDLAARYADLLVAKLSRVASDFQRHIATAPDRAFWRGFDDRHLDTLQIEFWRNLFGGRMDQALEDRAITLAIRHRDAGRTTEAQVVAHGWISTRLAELLDTEVGRPRPEMRRLATVANLLLTVELALASRTFAAQMID
ncbi:protoglobin domain-containing protein [Methyloraptor flagellatus]|uniref:Protoglobin domain-containing protein n=1 Tax=Methyloraptor flagellatus TaxID=3162530 RepID=A0AAU7XFH6_9HYPH